MNYYILSLLFIIIISVMFPNESFSCLNWKYYNNKPEQVLLNHTFLILLNRNKNNVNKLIRLIIPHLTKQI